jgi:hypothetical protein
MQTKNKAAQSPAKKAITKPEAKAGASAGKARSEGPADHWRGVQRRSRTKRSSRDQSVDSGTDSGKATASKNATVHGLRTAEWLEEKKLLNSLLRECRERLRRV